MAIRIDPSGKSQSGFFDQLPPYIGFNQTERSVPGTPLNINMALDEVNRYGAALMRYETTHLTNDVLQIQRLLDLPREPDQPTLHRRPEMVRGEKHHVCFGSADAGYSSSEHFFG